MSATVSKAMEATLVVTSMSARPKLINVVNIKNVQTVTEVTSVNVKKASIKLQMVLVLISTSVCQVFIVVRQVSHV